jgi:putative lipoprotein
MMRAPFLLLLSAALLSACGHFGSTPERPAATVRLQGELYLDAGRLLLQPCGQTRRLLIEDIGKLDLARDAQALGVGSAPIHADLRGSLTPASGNQPDSLRVTQRYRLAAEGGTCNDELRRTLVQARGNEPGWLVRVASKGLVLERPGQPAQALPYLAEQLPGGQSSYSSEANGQQLELWIAPQRCVDSMSGAVSHLAAELRLNGSVERGCAWYGGARHE